MTSFARMTERSYGQIVYVICCLFDVKEDGLIISSTASSYCSPRIALPSLCLADTSVYPTRLSWIYIDDNSKLLPVPLQLPGIDKIMPY